MNTENPTVTGIRLVPWGTDQWGVAIDYSDRQQVAYCIGTRAEAEAEIARVRTEPGYALKVHGRA
ncbi:MAG: hypothetical protein WBQ24_20745 [Xanthobacteraceae bacterium]|jgi:hypothetical protein